MKNKFARVLGALAIALLSQAALAAPISADSQLSTGGTLKVIGGDGSVANATGIDFTYPGHEASESRGALTGYVGNGALSSFNCMPDANAPCGFIKDIDSFDLFSGLSLFIDAGTQFSFMFDTPLTVTRVPGTPNAAAALILSGQGTLSFSGYDPTEGLFTLVTLNNSTGPTTYSATLFSLGTLAPTSVPEPATLLMMGLGLAGLMASRRKAVV